VSGYFAPRNVQTSGLSAHGELKMTYQSERKQFLTALDELPPTRLRGKILKTDRTPKWELDLDAALDAEDRAEMARSRGE
jgi:hypothetical protein